MNSKKLLQSVILTSLLVTTTQANSDGVYIGIESSAITFGKDSLKITNKDKSSITHKEIKNTHYNIKIGYQHFKNNRVEVYYRNNNIDTLLGELSQDIYGINYEWAFSCLTKNHVTPYLLLGIGGGEVTSKKLKNLYKSEIGEGNFGLGIHYQLNENIDVQVAYNYIATGFDKFDNKTTDKTSIMGQDSFILGLSYKF